MGEKRKISREDKVEVHTKFLRYQHWHLHLPQWCLFYYSLVTANHANLLFTYDAVSIENRPRYVYCCLHFFCKHNSGALGRSQTSDSRCLCTHCHCRGKYFESVLTLYTVNISPRCRTLPNILLIYCSLRCWRQMTSKTSATTCVPVTFAGSILDF